jgi:hypothetical protein
MYNISLARLIVRPWRWRQYFPPNAGKILPDFTASQPTRLALVLATAVRTYNLAHIINFFVNVSNMDFLLPFSRTLYEEIDSNCLIGRRIMSQTQESALSPSTELLFLVSVALFIRVPRFTCFRLIRRAVVIGMRGTDEERLPLLNRSDEAKAQDNIGTWVNTCLTQLLKFSSRCSGL